MTGPLNNVAHRLSESFRAIRFDRNEIAGAFGDIGTDLPLIVGMILASGLDPTSVLVMFGLAQIASALLYGMPMAVQPLKVVAALVIAANGTLDASTIFGAGIAIAAIMLVLTLSGVLEWLRKIIPKAVIRGIQFGLGIKLTMLASTYIQADGRPGFVLAAICFGITVCLLGNRRFPPALIVMAIGLLYAFCFRHVDATMIRSSFGFSLPGTRVPSLDSIVTGLAVLALPQIPLSLGNSIFATEQLANDLFPEKKVTLRKIGLTYSILNFVMPFFGGIPVCHGSGGLAGHHAFGGRTGGSVVIYGAMYLGLGLFFSGGFQHIIRIFPLPVLGIILLFEGFSLMKLVVDLAEAKFRFSTALLVGMLAFSIPKYGFLIGIVVGTIISHIPKKYNFGVGMR